MRKLLFFPLFLLCPFFLISQTNFKSYNQHNNLVFKDEFVWTTTYSGVVQRRTDTGEICAIYNYSNSILPNTQFNQIAIDSQGKILVSAGSSLYRFENGVWETLASNGGSISTIGFDENDFPVVETAAYTNYSPNCVGTGVTGIREIDIDNNGGLWSLYSVGFCGGSSSGCGCQSKYVRLLKWEINSWKTIYEGSTSTTTLGRRLAVAPDSSVFSASGRKIYHYHPDSTAITEIEISTSFNTQIYDLIVSDDGLLWLSSSEGFYTFDGTEFTQISTRVENGTFGKNTDGTIFYASRLGLMKWENNDWTVWIDGLLDNDVSDIFVGENATFGTGHNRGVSYFDGSRFEPFLFGEEALPEGRVKHGIIDTFDHFWINMEVADTFALLAYDGAVWTDFDTINTDLVSLNFSDIHCSANKDIWFIYENQEPFAVCKYDFETWTNFANIDTFYNAFPELQPNFWSLQNTTAVRTENGISEEFPLPFTPLWNDVLLLYTTISADGHAWIIHHHPFDVNSRWVYYFDGNEWYDLGGTNWYQTYPERIITEANEAWFFCRMPGLSDNPSSIEVIHFTGENMESIDIPNGCQNGELMTSLSIFDIEKTADGDYWMVYSTYPTQDCASRIFASFDGTSFEVFSSQHPYTDDNLITGLEKTCDGDILVITENGIESTFDNYVVDIFSKNANCNEGQLLACVSSGGHPPFSYQWSSGQNTAQIFPANPGSYTVTISDNLGFQSIHTTEIFGDAVLAINPVFNLPTDDNSMDGNIDLQLTEGSPPFTFLWENGSTDSVRMNLALGIYAYTVTDAVGCIFENEINLTAPLTVETEILKNPCFEEANGTAELLITGGIPPYAAQWSTGHDTTFVENIPAGSHLVKITDSVGNCEYLYVEVAETEEIALNFMVEEPTCSGDDNGKMWVQPTGGTPPYQYLWENGNTTDTLTNLSSDFYYLTVMDANGCEQSGGKYLSSPSPLTVYFNELYPIAGMSNGTATAFPSGGGISPFTYLWDNGVTTATNENLATGWHTLTITDVNGCTVIDSLFLPTELIVNANYSPFLNCDNGQNGFIHLDISSGQPPFDIVWIDWANNLDLTGLIQDSLAIGNYQVTITDSIGQQFTEIFEIEANGEFNYNHQTEQVSCPGAADGVLEFNPSGGTPPYQILWEDGFTELYRDGLSGGYYAGVITDFFGCEYEFNIFLLEFPPPNITFSVQDAAPNTNDGQVSVAVTGVNTPFQILWDNGSTSFDLDDLAAGSYYCTITDNVGCTFVDSVAVDILSNTIDLEEKFDITVFPNPFQNDFQIEFNLTQNVDCQIFIKNALQQSVDYFVESQLLNTGKQQIEIKTADWMSGIYFVEIWIGEERGVWKIVKY